MKGSGSQEAGSLDPNRAPRRIELGALSTRVRARSRAWSFGLEEWSRRTPYCTYENSRRRRIQGAPRTPAAGEQSAGGGLRTSVRSNDRTILLGVDILEQLEARSKSHLDILPTQLPA